MLKTENSKVFYVLITLACMNFLGRGSIVFLLLCICELLRRNGHVILDKHAIAAGLFSLCVFFASAIHYSYAECIKAANYFLLYILGYDSFRRAKNKAAFVEQTLFAVCAGFGSQLILMYLYNFGREQLTPRSLYSVWTKEPIAVTLLGLLVSVVIGFSFYAFFFSQKRSIKYMSFLFLAIGLLISFKTATRTPLLLFVLVYAIMLTLHLHHRRGRHIFRYLGAGIVFAGVLFGLYQMDVGGIQGALQQASLIRRFQSEGFTSGRFEITKTYFSLMMDYPWGGRQIEQVTGSLAHNYLQDGYDLYGIIAMIPLVAITLQCCSNMLKLLKKRTKSGMDMLFLSMYFSMLIQMCVEPVFTGYPILMWSLFLMHGMITAYLNTELRKHTTYKIRENL